MSSPRWRAWPVATPTAAMASFGLNILDFGGVNDGSADNTAALQSAFAVLGATGGLILFPAGKYMFSDALSLTYPTGSQFDLILAGEGQDASILYWPNSDGLNIVRHNNSGAVNNQSTHVLDLSFTTGAAPSSGFYGLTIQETGINNGSYAATSEINRVTFCADGGVGVTHGWGIDLNIVGISNINIIGCYFQGPSNVGGIGVQYGGQRYVETTSSSSVAIGTGSKTFTVPAGLGFMVGDPVSIVETSNAANAFVGTVTSYSGTSLVINVTSSTGSGTHSDWTIFDVLVCVFINIIGCTFNLKTYGYQVSNAFTQGVFFSQCDWAGCTIGINVPALSQLVNGVALAELAVVSCQFGVYATGICISANSASPISHLTVNNTLFQQNTASTGGIVAPLEVFSIFGNIFQAATTSGTVGVQVTSSTYGGIIADNFFGTLGSGITLQSGCYHVGIGANAYYGNTLNVTNGAVAGHENVCTLYGAQDQGYTHYMGNEGGGAGDHGVFIFAGDTAASDSSTVLIGFGNGNRTSVVGSVTRGGTGVSYNTTSDAALKEDFGAVKEDSLGALRALKVQSFRWKDGGGEVPAGLVAQHVHEVLPRYVREGSDPKSDPWTIDSSLNPTLVRAIQQLAEESEALREKIISLEGLLRAKDEK